MSKARRPRAIRPRDIWQGWPDVDLWPYPRPKVRESYAAYVQRLPPGALDADRLLHFVMAELCGEPIALLEAQRRLRRARKDLQDLQTALWAIVGQG